MMKISASAAATAFLLWSCVSSFAIADKNDFKIPCLSNTLLPECHYEKVICGNEVFCLDETEQQVWDEVFSTCPMDQLAFCDAYGVWDDYSRWNPPPSKKTSDDPTAQYYTDPIPEQPVDQQPTDPLGCRSLIPDCHPMYFIATCGNQPPICVESEEKRLQVTSNCPTDGYITWCLYGGVTITTPNSKPVNPPDEPIVVPVQYPANPYYPAADPAPVPQQQEPLVDNNAQPLLLGCRRRLPDCDRKHNIALCGLNRPPVCVDSEEKRLEVISTCPTKDLAMCLTNGAVLYPEGHPFHRKLSSSSSLRGSRVTKKNAIRSYKMGRT